MAIKFNVVRRANPARPEAPHRHYPSIQSSGRMTLRELAEAAADRSTLSTADMMAAVESFLAIIPDALADGRIVELGEFGSFWLRSDSSGEDSAEDVRSAHIRGLIPRFMPGKRFKRILAAVKFEKLP